MAQDFDLYGWRCACCGSGTWRWLSHRGKLLAEMPRRGDVPLASGRWLPREVYRYACNEIKLLEKGFGTEEPPVTGTFALQDALRRSQSNEEDRFNAEG